MNELSNIIFFSSKISFSHFQNLSLSFLLPIWVETFFQKAAQCYSVSLPVPHLMTDESQYYQDSKCGDPLLYKPLPPLFFFKQQTGRALRGLRSAAVGCGGDGFVTAFSEAIVNISHHFFACKSEERGIDKFQFRVFVCLEFGNWDWDFFTHFGSVHTI